MDGSKNPSQKDCLRAYSIFTSAAEGDFAVPALAHPQTFPAQAEQDQAEQDQLGAADSLRQRRASIAPAPWTWLRQVHGGRVVVVEHPGEFAGAEADAAVTAVSDAVLCVQTADCAGVLFAGFSEQKTSTRSDENCVVAVGAAHAGWRRVAAGILQSTVEALVSLGAQSVVWELGPCISPAAYEFGEIELAALVDRYGESLRGRTDSGAPALDLRAAVRAALSETPAVYQGSHSIPCTATDPGFFSWRARQDSGRQTSAIWMTANSTLETAGVRW
ncbi:MAG: polyphenol oxidase family protein [Actinobacteria bacterium]|nr:polyphenol oxidase family protein [Actinomycetota bacterium]